jgi:hypothetical protein
MKANTKNTSSRGDFAMTRRDQALLDRQLRGLHIPERHDGTMIMAIVMIFLVGLFLGNLHSKTGETALSVSNAASQTLAVLR